MKIIMATLVIIVIAMEGPLTISSKVSQSEF